MTDEALTPKVEASEKDSPELLAKYGITCVPINNYYYREFHYTNLMDAIAQSIRDKAAPGRRPPG